MEFCAVSIVSADNPYTPRASDVFRSACTPAAPLESEPAMVSTRGGITRGSLLEAPHKNDLRHPSSDSWAFSNIGQGQYPPDGTIAIIRGPLQRYAAAGWQNHSEIRLHPMDSGAGS